MDEKKTMAAGPKVAREVAEQEFERFADEMELDLDVSMMSDEDKKSLADAKDRIIKAMMGGHLVINESGEPVYTPRRGNTSPITFHEPTGGTISSGDSKKKDAAGAKMNAMLAHSTHDSPQRFEKMVMRDWKVCAAIQSLFMG